jgi:hypothetical protein
MLQNIDGKLAANGKFQCFMKETVTDQQSDPNSNEEYIVKFRRNLPTENRTD